ncbi:MAG: hypothetical protein AAGD01_09160 [Acidobacteriota bacterium]
MALLLGPLARGQGSGYTPESFVYVTNLQQPHPISGEVSVGSPIPHTRFIGSEEIVVSPARRDQSTQLTDPGLVIDTAGFSYATLSLQGEIKGRPVADGRVGAVLIPDYEPFLQAFREEGALQLPLEVAAPVAAQQSLSFAASAPAKTVGFPRYRVLFYNSTDKTAAVSLYTYLAH